MRALRGLWRELQLLLLGGRQLAEGLRLEQVHWLHRHGGGAQHHSLQVGLDEDEVLHHGASPEAGVLIFHFVGKTIFGKISFFRQDIISLAGFIFGEVNFRNRGGVVVRR